LGTVVRALLLLVCFWVAGPSWAQGLDRLFSDSPTLELAAPLQWQVLPKGSVPGPQVFDTPAGAQAFLNLPADVLLPTKSGQELWLRFSLPATPEPQQWYLRMPRVSIGSITLYAKNQQQEWMAQKAGDVVPVGSWPMPTRSPSFQLLTRTDQAQSYLVKIEHRTPLFERLQLIDSNTFIENASRVSVFVGLLIGVFGLLAAIALVAAWLFRAMQFVWFALVMSMMLLVQLIAVGHAGMKFWPGSVHLGLVMAWVSVLLMLASVTWFSLQVSYAKQSFTKIYRVSLLLIVVLVAMAAVFAVQPERIVRGILNAVAIAVIVWNIAILAWVAWRSQPWLWMIVVGLVPAVGSFLMRMAYNLGLLEHAEMALFLGAAVGATGMVLVFTRLVAHNRDGYSTRQRDSSLTTKDVNTGLTLGAVAEMRLPQVLLRSQRFAEPCGVLMLRWVEQDKFTRDMGFEKRSAVLLSLGARLSRLVRPFDTVARLDEDYICLVESPVTRHSLNDLGMRVLTTCLRPTRSLPDGAFYHMHVAIWVSTDHNTLKAPEVLAALRAKLKQMGHDGKRALQFVDSPSNKPGGSDHLLSSPQESAFNNENLSGLSANWGADSAKLRNSSKPKPESNSKSKS
jgi:two-component system, sensor histidine kinase LadS